jgi:hypothetical protein
VTGYYVHELKHTWVAPAVASSRFKSRLFPPKFTTAAAACHVHTTTPVNVTSVMSTLSKSHQQHTKP